MKTEELRKMDITALKSLSFQIKRELFETRYGVQNGISKNSHHIGQKRLQIARIKTIIDEIEDETQKQ